MVENIAASTKELLGANDAALGNVDPKNTSAIIAVQKAAAIPHENIKFAIWQLVEDLGLNWLDFMVTNYDVPRKLSYREDGKTKIIKFDGKGLRNVQWNLKVDVGPSSYYSDIASDVTMDNLLSTKEITFLQYLERISDGRVPKRLELMEEIKKQIEAQSMQAPPQGLPVGQPPAQPARMEAQMPAGGMDDGDQQLLYELLAQFVEKLPPDMQAQLQSLPPDEMESQVKQMVMSQ